MKSIHTFGAVMRSCVEISCATVKRVASIKVDPLLLDWLPVVGLLLLGISDVGLTGTISAPRLARVLFSLVIALPVGFRKRAPLAAVTVSAGGVVTQSVVLSAPSLGFGSFLAVLIGVYAVAAHAELRRAITGIALVAASMAVMFAVDPTARVEDVVFPLVYFGGAWGLGRLLRARTHRIVELRELAKRLEAEQEQRAQLAVAEERTRIARELHDIVAHGVTTIVLQAQGAQEVLAEDPGRAQRMLRTIQETGRESLVELRRLLHLLRTEDDDSRLDPQPGIAVLEALVERIRAGGTEVDLVVEGDPSRVPPAMQVSVYRIVQEALTNTLKHAGPARAGVQVRCLPGEIVVEVVDDGRTRPTNGAADLPGHGLVGIAERVKLFGGDVRYGRRAEGGFEMRAVIPVDER